VAYLDNNSTTAVDPQVFEAMRPYLEDRFGNPSSLHEAGRKVREGVDEAREKLASLLNCSHQELIFTSGGTEAINSAISACLEDGHGKKLVISSVEHAAVEDFAKAREDSGIEVSRVGVDQNGLLDLDGLENSIDENVGLASVIWAHNETGIITPVEKVVEICHQKGVLLHLDAVQAVGKLAVDLRTIGCDLLSVSAHKFHGPKGVGALFIRDGVKWNPSHLGGGQEKGRRAGTEAVPNIIGLGKACELAIESMEANAITVSEMRDDFESEISENFSFAKIIGREAERLPNTSNVCFEGFEAETLLPLLDMRGVYASHGAACSSGSWAPPRVLKEMSIPDELAKGSIRFSWSKFNKKEELSALLGELNQVFQMLS
jgi:cysteine desulfurase